MERRIVQYYPEDFDAVTSLFEQLQDYLIGLDRLKFLVKTAGFGRKYLHEILEVCKNQNGLMLCSKSGSVAHGVIVGVIEDFNPLDALSHKELKIGRVLELVVSESYRSLGIGGELMQAMEEHFKARKCDAVYVEVFEPNTKAHTFYETLGYRDRSRDMIKLLK